MKIIVSDQFQNRISNLSSLLKNFSSTGRILSSGRNEIRIVEQDNLQINIKSFRIPNLVNKIAYSYFRKSKAQRSFEYASILTKKGIGTPLPIAYAEEKAATFGKSFYICEHLNCDFTFRDLTANDQEILAEFTRFTYELHENKIEFLDHSPGNTLIKKGEQEYKFYLVDLNRMNFRNLDFDNRMKNFARLTSEKKIVKIMAATYSKLYGKPEELVFEKMWFYTNQFQEKFQRKKRLKKKLKFWKSN